MQGMPSPHTSTWGKSSGSTAQVCHSRPASGVRHAALPAADCICSTGLSACDSRTARCQDVLRLVKQEQQERAEMLARYHNDPRACQIKRMGPGGGDVAGEAERLASVPAAGPQRPPSPTSFVTEFERVASGGSQQEAAVGMDPAHQVRTIGVRTERRLCPPH